MVSVKFVLAVALIIGSVECLRDALHSLSPEAGYQRACVGRDCERRGGLRGERGILRGGRRDNALHAIAPRAGVQGCLRSTVCYSEPKVWGGDDEEEAFNRCWVYYDEIERIPYQRCRVRFDGPYEGEIDNIAVRARVRLENEEDLTPDGLAELPDGWQYEATSIEIAHSCFKCGICPFEDRDGCYVEFDISRDADVGPNTLLILTTVFEDREGIRLNEPVNRITVCRNCIEVRRWAIPEEDLNVPI